LKHNNLVRICLIVSLLILAVNHLSAQTTGFSNLEFVENKGQWDPEVKFRADIGTGAFFLQKKGFTVLLNDTNDLRRLSDHSHRRGGTLLIKGSSKKTGGTSGGVDTGFTMRSHAYRMSFVDASEEVELVPDKPMPNYNNYFIGKDPSKWAGNCKIYQGVTYRNIYPGIDLRYYTNAGRLKYDLIVHPGADPDHIVMKYEGQDGLSVKKNLITIKTTVSEVKSLSPYSYQLDATGRRQVECRYVQVGPNTIGFKLKNYSRDETLVIDPSTVFCSFTGSTTDNWGFTATYGPDGSLYAGGIVAGPGWPVSIGAFRTSTNSGNSRVNAWDIGLMKFSSNGSSRAYATYLGGSLNEYPHSLVVDNAGNLIVQGRTYSRDFPFLDSVGQGGGADIFVTKFNASGTGLIGSLRVGGTGDDGVNFEDQGELNVVAGMKEEAHSLVRNYGDWSRSEVILDGANNIYVAACTQPNAINNIPDFPIVGSVFQSVFGGGKQDGVLLKINPNCNNVIFSSYLGGSKDDAALVLDLSPVTNEIYVGGATTSHDLQGTGGAVIQGAFRDSIDGFVSVIANDGSSLKATTYLSAPPSGSNIDMIYGLKFDRLGFPYVMGTSTGNWTVKNATPFYAGSKQFVAKLQPDLSDIVYSTVFGSPNAGQPNISPVAFLVDRCQNVYVSGWGGWYEAKGDPYDLQGTNGMYFSADADKKSTDNRDFYFIVLKRDAASVLYASFFGQTDDANSISEHVDGGTSRFDKNGVIYQAICANCSRGDPSQADYIKFPTSFGAYKTINGAGDHGCNLAALKIRFDFAGVSAALKSSLAGRGDSVGCIPLDVTLQDTSRNAKKYYWRYGDGSKDDTTTSYIMNHTYTTVGTFQVRLIAIDSSTCNITDTAYLNITARNDRAPLDFRYTKVGDCNSLSFNFYNTSQAPAGKPFGDSSFVWDFGDGKVVGPTDSSFVLHYFASAGSYVVKLMLVDTNYCNYPDTLPKLVSIAANVKAQFVTPPAGCAPYNIAINNTSIAGQQFYWDFGDGSTSTDRTPAHIYPLPGVFTIKLVVVDSATCNIADSTTFTVTIHNKPAAAFTTTPDPPVANTPTVFHNSSTGALKYKWLFGDGDSETSTSSDTVMHQYNITGNFNACLVAYNQFGCTDTVCHPVATLINPLLDVPNAFTPGRFGQNGIIKVYGFGIVHMTFRIYNRWGQMVFESNDRNIGWDGVYKGTVQPMDVYGYTLEAEFFDGTRASRKGSITLVR